MIDTDEPGKGESMSTTEALEVVQEHATAVRDLEREAAERLAARDRAILEAQKAGATYPQLSLATGLTRDRVAQVLAKLKRQRAQQ